MAQAGNRARGQMAHHGGDAAERRIARHYERLGYALAAARWRGPGGEIDLILRRGGEVVFVEVKKSATIAGAAERIGPVQMARIRLSAERFLDEEPLGQLTESRFDVALMDAAGAFEILENAFGQG
ncbi:YraN family protein [Sedimentitalea sp. JM2-8]|uniref:UPF0102 protein QO034_03535 n=1 Tax=Sedimentitalea xiamensis TaxID=3050037 RepID=A0ABT7FAN1_9RHOB|nr:YraN family protein [Sedimentitalea xiamensis]MDK3072172.1 YraN family protein [Sedimentitalea xiamensis]